MRADSVADKSWRATFFGSLFSFGALGIFLADLTDAGTLGRLVWYLGPWILTIALMQVLGASSAAKVGATIVAASYLLLFYLWVNASPHPEALAWVSYLFCYPGAWMAGVATSFLDRKNEAYASKRFLRSVAFQLSGLLANIAVVFALLM